VLACFGVAGKLSLHWGWMPLVIPLLFLAALAFSAIGLYFTAILPSIDHMSLPFFLVIMPVGFASSTYFPLPDVPVLRTVALLNPLHHLSEGLRALLLAGTLTWHLAAATALCMALLVALIPVDMRLLRKRVFGDG
jgi:lipooligosaccharide transport system permease protein